jgi:threonine dehydrogenase-like Zn-dependent dehydrogenase
MEQKCERLFKYGHGMNAGAPSGGLSELIVLRPGTLVLEVPEGLADEVVCPANCATATVAACFRVAGPVRGRTVLVQGAGLLGLTAAAMAAAEGAAEVHVVDPAAERRELARRFGATATGAEGAPAVDVAFEFSGRSAAMPALRVGGVWVLAGAVFSVPRWCEGSGGLRGCTTTGRKTWGRRCGFWMGRGDSFLLANWWPAVFLWRR